MNLEQLKQKVITRYRKTTVQNLAAESRYLQTPTVDLMKELSHLQGQCAALIYVIELIEENQTTLELFNQDGV